MTAVLTGFCARVLSVSTDRARASVFGRFLRVPSSCGLFGASTQSEKELVQSNAMFCSFSSPRRSLLTSYQGEATKTRREPTSSAKLVDHLSGYGVTLNKLIPIVVPSTPDRIPFKIPGFSNLRACSAGPCFPDRIDLSANDRGWLQPWRHQAINHAMNDQAHPSLLNRSNQVDIRHGWTRSHLRPDVSAQAAGGRPRRDTIVSHTAARQRPVLLHV